MATARILIFFLFSNALMGQSVCDQFLSTLHKTDVDTLKKRSFRMTSQINGDKNINFTECDTLGRIHFWGDVGSLKIESFYADGKRYSKIQSAFIKDDEWTYQEVKGFKTDANKFFKQYKNDLQNIDCQIVGEETIKKKTYQILSYTIRKNMLKRNGIDSFLMDMKVKTWYCPTDSLILKYTYETTTEHLSQTVKSTLEYDVPVKIVLPKNAKFEEQRKIMLTQNAPDTFKKEALKEQIHLDSSQTKDSVSVDSVFQEMPEYKEGMTALSKYISNHINYPEEARKAGVSGTVYVDFIVETDGKLSNIHIKRGLRDDIDSEAKRIVESMSGAWKAGKINGSAVRSAYTLPLKFELRE